MSDTVTLQSGYPLKLCGGLEFRHNVMYVQARSLLRSPTIACGLDNPCFPLTEKLPECPIARPAEVAW